MLTIADLDAQSVELLPAKETLLFDLNIADVYAINSSVALNVGTLLSTADSAAWQDISVTQG
jgi:hypothetical protein